MTSNSPHQVILTGASDGIGKALALELARRGCSLALFARRKELLETVKESCLKLGSKKVLVFAVDVTLEAEFQAALDEADQQLDGATLFIANAGITGRSSLQETSWEYSKKCLTINVVSAIHGIERMKLKMAQRGHGILCGVTSIAGARGMPTSGVYSASKAALSTYLETLRIDLKPYGVAVVDVMPGFIDTPMTKKNKGFMPFLMDAERAAVIFVDGIFAKKRVVIAPKFWAWALPIMRNVPRALFDWASGKTYNVIRGDEFKPR